MITNDALIARAVFVKKLQNLFLAYTCKTYCSFSTGHVLALCKQKKFFLRSGTELLTDRRLRNTALEHENVIMWVVLGSGETKTES